MTFNMKSAVIRDLLISLAEKLPENLVVDPNTAEGKATIAFLFSLSEEDLASLRKEAGKLSGGYIHLEFSYRSKVEPFYREVKMGQFPWEGKKVSFNGDTDPYQHYSSENSLPYISAKFDD